MCTRGCCQRVWEVTPLFNGTQRIVQKDDWIAFAVIYTPTTYEYASAWNLYERVKNLDAHRECAFGA
jgi:hypothetical protein